MIIPVVLSGGSGTRLWPLSTPEKPKQFLALVSEKSLFQETLLRLDGIPGLEAPIVVCNEAHRILVAEQLDEIDVTAQAIVLEPEGRNTAPAIGIAAILASRTDLRSADEKKESGVTSEPVLLVLPADHVITDAAALRAAVTLAVKAAEAGNLVTFGIVPTRAETGYGYIERARGEGDWSRVERFVEKPDAVTAQQYIASGGFLWNSGIFAFGASTLLTELERYAHDIFLACQSAAAETQLEGDFTRLGPEFLANPSDSIDCAVMEKTDRAAVIPLDAGWNDVGSWDALYEVLEKDASGNAIRGDVVSLDANDCLVFSDSRKIAFLGLDNIAVIEAGDTILIMSMERSQDVKRIRMKLESDSS